MKKVLIAEDNLVDSTVIAKIVEGAGYCALRASTGLTAWKFLLDNPDVALIITDYVMPDMNGEQLVTSIRSHEVHKEKPVIIVSGIVKIKDVDHILKVGASRFVPKPVQAEELRGYLSMFLGQ